MAFLACHEHGVEERRMTSELESVCSPLGRRLRRLNRYGWGLNGQALRLSHGGRPGRSERWCLGVAVLRRRGCRPIWNDDGRLEVAQPPGLWGWRDGPWRRRLFLLLRSRHVLEAGEEGGDGLLRNR